MISRVVLFRIKLEETEITDHDQELDNEREYVFCASVVRIGVFFKFAPKIYLKRENRLIEYFHEEYIEYLYCIKSVKRNGICSYIGS